MFSFDSASLPQLTTRKALICVDFQNDFTTATGALPVLEPDALLTRTVELANKFRSFGDVVWVQSRFEAVRPVNSEQILASDLPSTLRPNSRSRRRVSVEPDDGPPDQEAFLSQPEPVCVKADSEGSEVPSVVKDATQKSDMVLTKTHYSAFNSTHLLRVLRAKMVMEVFICGSLANIGVYATALDAAGHGMTITIVEDCCGFRSDTRQAIAVRNLIDLTGCEVASSEEVLESLKPKQPKFKKPPPPKRVESSRRSTAAPSTPSTSASATTTTTAADEEAASRGKSETPEFIKNIRKLRLASDEPVPVATAAAQPIEAQPQDQPYERAPATSVSAAAERHESLDVPPSTPPSKVKESIRENESPTVKVDKEGDEVGELVKKDEETEVKEENEKDIKQSNTSQTDNNNISNDTSTSDKKSPTTESKATITPLELTEDTTEMKNTAATPESEEGPLLQRGLCEGDTDVIENVLPASLEDGIFDKLRDEIQWQRMSHQGGEVPRLVAVQGLIAEDGSMPVYRHPSDESPPLLAFTPTVLAIKVETEKHLGHPLNHVLIQFYRDGNDYISEHSDKTLDIVQGSFIANVSLGAERTMVLRTKRLDKDPSRTGPAPTDTKRKIQRARLPHNSLCRMGLKTNMKWLHAIRQDKRAERDKTPAELAYKGGRISLTFRQIGTFLDKDETLIWGQGATGKTREEAQPVINGQSEEAIKMLRAFGTENHASEFDWAAHYGKGFDVLHMSNAPRLFASPDPIVNNRIALMLAEHGINYAKGSMGATKSAEPDNFPVKFVDNDAAKSTVQGDMAIMLYLNAQYGAGKDASAPEQAKQFTRFQQGLHLLDKYRALEKDESGKRDMKLLNKELTTWDSYAGEHENGFLAGEKPTLPDFTVWPVLHALVEEDGQDDVFQGLEKLKEYYKRVLERDSAKKILQK